MSINRRLSNPALNNNQQYELNEEWNNFMKKIGEVSGLVKDMASGDKDKADAAKAIADEYLKGKVILDEDVKMKGEIDKDAWMAEVSKDAHRRALDRKIRKEKADTLKTQAVKAFRRQEYDRALSYYNRAIEQVKDNSMLYCDRALTNIKLGNYEKVFNDCEWALRLNENSFKARLYKAKAYKELEEFDKLQECRRELDEMFAQHDDLIKYFLDKKEGIDEDADGVE
ncbi:tetratricopeptide repeat protein 12-like isoform X2 [Maniola hyperantus]|uniref:tetratricopeptide repeat protein 12-like isoform X2 n=1 Tax=Aphantopus hyperantus TaxID=2795564 RepID=UPI001569A06B|nr:tetratricopeptide repeat protein 12-like isoform X2 [Maniola hyperantus]